MPGWRQNCKPTLIPTKAPTIMTSTTSIWTRYEHDPYVLISLLSALHEGEWTLSQVEGSLQMLFDRQYILTERVEVETRYDSDDVTLFVVHLLCRR